MAQIQRNAVIIQALFDVSRKSARIRLNLKDSKNFCALKRHSARHDHANIAGTEDDDVASHHRIFQVDVSLSHARRHHARRTLSRYRECAPRSLSTSHCEDNRIRLILQKSIRRCRSHKAILCQTDDRRVRDNLNSKFFRLIDKATRILRTAERLLETG